jgi:hypothetical protein
LLYIWNDYNILFNYLLPNFNKKCTERASAAFINYEDVDVTDISRKRENGTESCSVPYWERYKNTYQAKVRVLVFWRHIPSCGRYGKLYPILQW